MTYGYSQKKDSSLIKIIVVIAIIGGVAVGGWTLARRFNIGTFSGASAASAADSLRAASEFYAGGKLDDARVELETLMSHLNDDKVASEALLLLARIDTAQGMYDA